MNEPHKPTAPTGYFHHGPLVKRINLPGWQVLILANLIALIPLTVGLLLLWIPYQLYLAMGAPLTIMPTLAWPLGVAIPVGIIIFILSMLFHEWLHGTAMYFMGYRPKYYSNWGALFAGLREGDYLSRPNYLIMTLTPILLMSAGGLLVLLFLPPVIGRLLLIALLLNTAASIGDIFVAVAVYRSPKSAIFRDDKGIQMFLPTVDVETAVSQTPLS
ncbi:MAG: DUF3267 domain-containing protein [Chloroflexi bacterium]|nr:DUF3267 domain-containing protein [Chloroflexota bacterium]